MHCINTIWSKTTKKVVYGNLSAVLWLCREKIHINTQDAISHSQHSRKAQKELLGALQYNLYMCSLVPKFFLKNQFHYIRSCHKKYRKPNMMDIKEQFLPSACHLRGSLSHSNKNQLLCFIVISKINDRCKAVFLFRAKHKQRISSTPTN